MANRPSGAVGVSFVVAGTSDAVLMVESEAKELSEEVMLEAVMTGHRGFQPVIDAIIRLAERAAKDEPEAGAEQPLLRMPQEQHDDHDDRDHRERRGYLDPGADVQADFPFAARSISIMPLKSDEIIL